MFGFVANLTVLNWNLVLLAKGPNPTREIASHPP
jgi:hypothetical protein